MRDLPPTAGGKKFSKLSRKGRGKNGAKNKKNEKTEVKPENPKVKNCLTHFNLIHSPIERSSQSLSKRGRIEMPDSTFDISCDLFGYTADVSNASDKAGVSQKTSEESVFGSPMTSFCTVKKGSVETSTPNGLYVNPPKHHQLNESSVIQSEKQVTRSQVGKNGISSASNSHARNHRTSHHRANCRCGTCKLKYEETPDLFDLTNDISLLDLSNSCTEDVNTESPHQVTEGKYVNNRSVEIRQRISPCSVIVTPLSDTYLSQYSNPSVSTSKSIKTDVKEKDNKDEDGDNVPDTSQCILLSSSDEDIEEVDERNGGMREDVTSSFVSEEPVDDYERIQDVCSESRTESNSYRLARSFKVGVTFLHTLKSCLLTEYALKLCV